MFLYETNAEIVNLEKVLCFLKYVQTRKELKWYHHIIGEIMSQQDIPDVTKQTSSLLSLTKGSYGHSHTLQG